MSVRTFWHFHLNIARHWTFLCEKLLNFHLTIFCGKHPHCSFIFSIDSSAIERSMWGNDTRGLPSLSFHVFQTFFTELHVRGLNLTLALYCFLLCSKRIRKEGKRRNFTVSLVSYYLVTYSMQWNSLPRILRYFSFVFCSCFSGVVYTAAYSNSRTTQSVINFALELLGAHVVNREKLERGGDAGEWGNKRGYGQERCWVLKERG